MLLSIIIVLCINKLIVQKEYFNDNYDHIYDELIAWMNSSPDNESTPELFRFNGSESGLKTTAQVTNPVPNWKIILDNMKKRHDPLPTQHQSLFTFDGSIPNLFAAATTAAATTAAATTAAATTAASTTAAATTTNGPTTGPTNGPTTATTNAYTY